MRSNIVNRIRMCSKRYFSSSRKASSTAGIFVFSSISVFAAGLGVWQVQRYQQKVDKINKSEKSLLLDMIDGSYRLDQHNLTDLILQSKAQKINIGSGTFDYRGEVLLGPRPGPQRPGSGAQGMATNPQGYYVITPFIRHDGTIVYVKRGWIPMYMKTWPRPTDSVKELIGIASTTEKKATFTPTNAPATGKLLWLEDTALLSASHINEYYPSHQLISSGSPGIPIIELVEFEDTLASVSSSFKPEYPIKPQAKYLNQETILPITHIVYAVTWFSLAAAGAVMTFMKFKKVPRNIISKSSTTTTATATTATTSNNSTVINQSILKNSRQSKEEIAAELNRQKSD